jgi:hypothetical protein
MTHTVYDEHLDAGAELLARFNAIEVHALRFDYTQDADSRGAYPMEQCEDDQAAGVWGVFGHLYDGGVDAICDCDSKATAEGIAALFEQLIAVRVTLENAV